MATFGDFTLEKPQRKEGRKGRLTRDAARLAHVVVELPGVPRARRVEQTLGVRGVVPVCIGVGDNSG